MRHSRREPRSHKSSRPLLHSPLVLYVPTRILQMSFAAPIASTFFSRLLRPFSTSAPGLSHTPESQSRRMSGTTEQATVAAGCFWGVEHLYRKTFGNGKGLLDAKVGYSGGETSSPSYRAVCSGSTGRKSTRKLPRFAPSHSEPRVSTDCVAPQTPKRSG